MPTVSLTLLDEKSGENGLREILELNHDFSSPNNLHTSNVVVLNTNDSE
jgi:hypothetical protein